MSKFATMLFPNRRHYLSNGAEVAFENGEAEVPDAVDDEMTAAGFDIEPGTGAEPTAPKRSRKKKPTTED